MSELKVNKISPRSGTDVTLGDSGDTFTLGSGANIAGLTLSDNILFDTASKGIYLGVTSATASNLLDDYEEGTWTPAYVSGLGSFGSITYLGQSGYYTKIGRIVQITFVISTNAITVGTASADVRISGLPFSISSSGVTSGAAVFGTAWGGDNPSFVALESGNSYLNLNYRTTSNGNLTASDVSDLSTGSNANKILASFTYQTA